MVPIAMRYFILCSLVFITCFMRPNSIEEIFFAFQKLKVLIVGDVMVDAYTWGQVDRISPEAPVPVVNVRKREVRLGGAANVALNIQALGATPFLCAVVGQDDYGKQFKKLLDEQQICVDFIVESPARVTTVKERVMAGSQQMLRVDSEDDSLLNERDSQALMQCIEKVVAQVDVIVFQDYDKGVLDEKRIQKIISLAHQQNKPTAVDPKRRNFLHYRNATLFKPNLKELTEGLKGQQLSLVEGAGKHFNKAEVIVEAADHLRKQLQADSVLVTLSEHGVFINGKDGTHAIPAHVRQIADVSGAGDTVVSIAALCLALQLPYRWLAALSNLGGGIVCEYSGVVPIDKMRLEEEAQKYIDFTIT